MSEPTSEKGETCGASTNNGADNKVPQWLVAEVFEDLLKENVTGYKKVKSFKAVPGTGAGENYATIMLRVELDIEIENEKTKTISYMMKLPHESEMYKDLIEKSNIFEIERDMYLTIVRELEQIYRDVGVEVLFGAKCYKLEAPTENVLLEDLRPKGFKNANRLEGLDMEHMHCVLKKLSQWHAASVVRVETKGKYSENLTAGFFKDEYKESITQMVEGFSKYLIKCMVNYAGHESYIDAVREMQQGLMDEIYKMAKTDPNDFNVLNHGDCWSNNIMFQYDAFGKIKETYFVDYQIPKYGTVAQDLLYAILSSANIDIKLSQFEYFIKYYHDYLTKHLKLLKYTKKLPSLKDIHIQLFKYGTWGFYTVSSVMGAVLLDPTETASIDNFLADTAEGADFKMQMFTNIRYRKHMEIIMPWLYNRGALSC